MTYPSMNGTLIGSDLMELFKYANVVTNNLFVPMMVLSFFLVVTIGSFIMQLRFTSRIRPEVSILAGSFTTLAFATILEQRSGLLAPWYFMLIIGVTILSAIWVFMGTD